MAELFNPSKIGGGPPPPPPPITYATLLKTSAPKSVTFQPTTCRAYRKEGKLAISFSKEDIEKGQKYISSKSVVLKFSAERPHLNLIRNNIFKDWNIEGNFTLGLLDPRHVLLSFEKEEEINKALSRYNCQIMGRRFKEFRWHPGFSFKKDPNLAPIWIDILKLPLHFF
ncbi:hypothetical protein FRX31_025922 [Thalictrum thalictroides]|uniref:DUF4283 domain-containing protein n=1 Tax=Thalictrum thalictroides TaxID=46969 RepID=A0A7J6VIG0_THATH|nr:hypothetical protein FRX31_025922 [Thalictrum thalictroides]